MASRPSFSRILFLLLTVTVCLFSCRDKPEVSEPVVVRAKPVRIVSFVPSLTEIAFDLGLGPQMVGVSSFDTWPPEVSKLQKLGGVVDPNLEAMLALEPDLILTTPAVKGVEALAAREKIPVLSVKTDTLAELFAAYRKVGAAAGIPEKGEAAAKNLKDKLDKLRPEKGAHRPRTLLVVGRDEGALSRLYAAGRGSFMDELLEVAGGDNALPNTLGAWPQVGRESLVAHSPEVVLEFAPTGVDPVVETRRARKVWAQMPEVEAVKKGRVHRLVGGHLLLPGPRVVQTVISMKEALGQKGSTGQGSIEK